VSPHLGDITLIARDIAQRKQRLGHPSAVAKGTVQFHALLEQCRGPRKLAPLTEQQPEPVECEPQTTGAHAATITPGAVLCDCLFQQSDRLLVVPRGASLKRCVEE